MAGFDKPDDWPEACAIVSTRKDVVAGYRSKVAGPFGVPPGGEGDPVPLDNPGVVVWGWLMVLEPRKEDE